MVMSPSQFYSNVGDPFGISIGRPNPHRGTDFPWGSGTEIPAYRQGVVVLNEWQSGLGWVVTLDYGDGVYGGFSHLRVQSAWGIGRTIGFGQVIGLVGNTGSLSAGAHLHATTSRTNITPWSGSTFDPLPYIRSSIQGNAQAANPIKEEEQLMRLIGNADTNNRDIYLLGPGGALHVQNEEDLAALRAVLLTGTATFRQIKLAEAYFVALRAGYKTTLIKIF